MRVVSRIGGAAAGVFALGALGVALIPALEGSAQTAAQIPGGTARVTFTKDVAPILQTSCQNCHRPGALAPMSLLTYQDVRPWAKAIKRRTTSREMPPWFIEKNIGIQQFKDDISLTDAQIATIAAWVDSGGVEGNPADMPPPRAFGPVDAGWEIGTPDLIVSVPQRWMVPAEGPDAWIDFRVPTGLGENRYIRAMQTRPGPGATRVIHHVTSTVTQQVDPSEKLLGNDSDAEEQGLSEYSMGKAADIMPEGTGMLLKPGSIVKFNVHYHPVGIETADDRTRLGIIFYPKGVVPKYQQKRIVVGQPVNGNVNGTDIPPGEANVRIDGYTRLDKPARLSAIQPHLHSRGKRVCVEAILPTTQGGQDFVTLNCMKFDFAWNVVYNYADDVAPLLPAGTVLHVIGWHDNSAANRYNPDPRNWSGWGARTVDTMNLVHAHVTFLQQNDFDRMVAERKAKKTN
jgi:hypothetical protein